MTPQHASASAARPPTPAGSTVPPDRGPPEDRRPPFLLDFFPLEEPAFTRVARFYERLREGHLSTTRCRRDGRILWPPRVSCPHCHEEDLEWVDLPMEGTLYAFSAVLGGAPLGMEQDVPFAVGLVDLKGVPLRLFGRIVGRPWEQLAIGEEVRVEPFDLPDARVFYRFRASPRA